MSWDNSEPVHHYPVQLGPQPCLPNAGPHCKVQCDTSLSDFPCLTKPLCSKVHKRSLPQCCHPVDVANFEVPAPFRPLPIWGKKLDPLAACQREVGFEPGSSQHHCVVLPILPTQVQPLFFPQTLQLWEHCRAYLTPQPRCIEARRLDTCEDCPHTLQSIISPC